MRVQSVLAAWVRLLRVEWRVGAVSWPRTPSFLMLLPIRVGVVPAVLVGVGNGQSECIEKASGDALRGFGAVCSTRGVDVDELGEPYIDAFDGARRRPDEGDALGAGLLEIQSMDIGAAKGAAAVWARLCLT